MATHCRTEDKNSIISYNFDGQAKKVVKINNAPIEVVVAEIPQPGTFTGLQCPIPYVVRYRSINNDGSVGAVREIGVTGAITSIQTGHLPSGFSSPFESEWQIRLACQGGGNSYANGIAIIRVIYTVYGYGELISIDPQPPYLDNCGDMPRDRKQCKITVNAIGGGLLINEQGNCPVSYDVACDSDCPPDTVRCSSDAYPGYCCISCSEIKGEIIAITNQVRSFNNG